MSKTEDELTMKQIGVIYVMVLTFVGLVIGVPMASWNYYKAGIQQTVYERQGVHMTRWECFMDVKPIERSFVQVPKGD